MKDSSFFSQVTNENYTVCNSFLKIILIKYCIEIRVRNYHFDSFPYLKWLQN
jgi:hypothetical protein